MITKTVGYKIGDQFFGTIEEAQKAELFNLQSPEAGDGARQGAIDIADWIIENKEAILDILTTTPNSKPSARKNKETEGGGDGCGDQPKRSGQQAMSKFYVTFGQSHVHSVNGETLDRDCVAELESETYEQARDFAFQCFGPKFCFLKDELPDMNYFPRGVIKLI